MQALAPIAVSTYGRVHHLRQTIEALKNNVLARDSELYIFSDAPKPGDEAKVSAVRDYAHRIDGFRKVHVVERQSNSRILNNRGGIESLLAQYGKVIFIEEDVVTAPGFLSFMNEALEFYKDHPWIGSVSGYCPPIGIPGDYPRDYFVLTRLNPWGVGLWSRYYRMNTPITAECYEAVYGDRKRLKALAEGAGEEAVEIIKMDFDRRIDAGDMKSIFWQFYEGKLTVYPRKTLSRSIGQDGTGLHMGVTDKWDVSELWDKLGHFEFDQNPEVDENIRKRHFDFYRVYTFKLRAIQFLMRVGLYGALRPWIKKIQALLTGRG